MASVAPSVNADLGRMIERGFDALKSNFVKFFGISLLFAGLPGTIWQYLIANAPENVNLNEAAWQEWAPTAGAWVASWIGGALFQAILARSTVLHLSGRDTDLPNSLTASVGMILPILGIAICTSFLFVLGLLVFIVPGLIFYCALFVSVPSLMEERRGAFASMARSRELTRGSRWQIFFLSVLLWVLAGVISGVVAQISVAAFGVDAEQLGRNSNEALMMLGASMLTASLAGVINAVFVAAAYVELREVKEGSSAVQLADIFV